MPRHLQDSRTRSSLQDRPPTAGGKQTYL